MKDFITFVAGVVLLCSCVEVVDIDSHRERKVVLNSMLSCTETIQSLTLMYNSKIGEFFSDSPENAKILLYKGEDLIGEYERYSYSEWRIEYKPEFKTTYTILVDVEGEAVLTASTTTPEESGVRMVSMHEDPERGKTKTFQQYRYDDPYWIFGYYTGGHDAETAEYLWQYSHLDFPIIPYLPKEAKLLEEIGTNHIFADNFNLSDHVSAYPMHEICVRIVPPFEPNDRFNFVVESATEEWFLLFRTASKEYDDYMKSSLKKAFLINEEYDISRWFDESRVYSNVTGGLGIFASYCDVIYYIPSIIVVND